LVQLLIIHDKTNKHVPLCFKFPIYFWKQAQEKFRIVLKNWLLIEFRKDIYNVAFLTSIGLDERQLKAVLWEKMETMGNSNLSKPLLRFLYL
jgi:hypothetical protein